jgi:hypothetical protein
VGRQKSVVGRKSRSTIPEGKTKIHKKKDKGVFFMEMFK